MSGCFSFCLCRFLHNLAIACRTGGNSGVFVWAHVNEYQHSSVSPHALSYTLLMLEKLAYITALVLLPLLCCWVCSVQQ